MLYNFTIQYCCNTLNPADESSQRLNYMMKQSERCHESSLMLICSEKFWQNEKYHENNLMSACSQEFQLTSTLTSNSSLMLVESSLMLWQIDDLMSMLVNKLVTVMLRADRQYSYHIRKTDSEMKCLIQVLSLQAITQLKIRLTADNLVLFRETVFWQSYSENCVFW